MKLIKGTAILVTGSIISMLINGIAGLIVARYLGPEKYGVFNAGVAIPAAVSLSFLLGIDGIVPREVAKDPNNIGNMLKSILYPIIVWMILLSVTILALGYLIGYTPGVYRVMAVGTTLYIFRSFALLFRTVLRGLECMALDVLIQLSESLGSILLVLILFKTSNSALIATIAYSGAAMFSMVVGGILTSKKLTHKSSFDSKLAKKIVFESFPLLIMATLLAFNSQAEIIILSHSVNKEQVGLYSAALSLFFLAKSISASFSASLLPRLSLTYKKFPNEFSQIWSTGIRFIIVLGIIMAIMFGIYATLIIMFIFGKDYFVAIPILRVLGITIGFKSINLYLTHVLIAIDKQKFILTSVFIGLIFTIIFSLILVPLYGISGVAWATVGREIAILIGFSIVLNKSVANIELQKSILLPILAGVIMIVILWGVKDSARFLSLLLLPISLSVFIVFLHLNNYFSTSEKELLRSLLSKIISKKS